MKKTHEDNSLIAEFMGCDYIDGKYRLIHSHQKCLPQELRYHKDWKWLMPVVQKILDQSTEDMEQFYIIRDAIPDIKLTHERVVKYIEDECDKIYEDCLYFAEKLYDFGTKLMEKQNGKNNKTIQQRNRDTNDSAL